MPSPAPTITRCCPVFWECEVMQPGVPCPVSPAPTVTVGVVQQHVLILIVLLLILVLYTTPLSHKTYQALHKHVSVWCECDCKTYGQVLQKPVAWLQASMAKSCKSLSGLAASFYGQVLQKPVRPGCTQALQECVWPHCLVAQSNQVLHLHKCVISFTISFF